MKIKKILIGLVSVFSLVAFSGSVIAVSSSPKGEPKSYLIKELKKSDDETGKVLMKLIGLSQTFSKIVAVEKDSALKKFIEERFIKTKKELKDYNKEDLEELIKVLENRLEKLKKNCDNLNEVKKSKEFRKEYDDYRKKLLNLEYENVEKLTEKQKEEKKKLKNTIGNYNCKEFKEFVNAQKEFAGYDINDLKKAISYLKKLKNGEISKKEVNGFLKILGNLDLKKLCKDFDYNECK